MFGLFLKSEGEDDPKGLFLQNEIYETGVEFPSFPGHFIGLPRNGGGELVLGPTMILDDYPNEEDPAKKNIILVATTQREIVEQVFEGSAERVNEEEKAKQLHVLKPLEEYFEATVDLIVLSGVSTMMEYVDDDFLGKIKDKSGEEYYPYYEVNEITCGNTKVQIVFDDTRKEKGAFSGKMYPLTEEGLVLPSNQSISTIGMINDEQSQLSADPQFSRNVLIITSDANAFKETFPKDHWQEVPNRLVEILKRKGIEIPKRGKLFILKNITINSGYITVVKQEARSERFRKEKFGEVPESLPENIN